MSILQDLIFFSRSLIVILSIYSVILWIIYYFKYKEPVAIAAITWLLNLIAFNIYRFWAVSELLSNHGIVEHPEIARIIDTWSAALHIHALVLLITAFYIFKDRK